MTRSERALVAGWTLLLMALAAIPMIHGSVSAPAGSRFAGFVGLFHNDYNGYLAWIRQAFDGHATFRILFTTEPHSRWFFHPLFLAMGVAAKLTGAALIRVWHVVQIAGCAALVPAVYGFCARCTPSRPARLLSLVLATTASGFGWIWIRMAPLAAGPPTDLTPIDLWMVEAQPFQAMVTSFFTLPIALALMLLALSRAINFLDNGRRKDALIGGSAALVLASVHPYEIVTLEVVLLAWTLLAGRHQWKGMALMLAFPLPYFIYAIGVTRLSPVFSEVVWAMKVPSARAHVLGWGLPLLLALGAMLDPRVRRENRRLVLPAAWLAATVVLLLVPIEFRRKLIWGAFVPICVLAAMGLATWGRRGLARFRRPWARLAVVACGCALVAMIAATGSVDFYARLLLRNREARLGDYLPTPYLEAMHWIEEHSEPAEVVVATPTIAPWLPGRTGVTVFFGHWAQTLDGGAKSAFIADFFSPESSLPSERVHRILDRNRVRYIVADHASIPGRGSAGPFAFQPLVRPVFENQAVTIWEVIGYRRTPDDTPWRAGETWGS